MSTFKVQQQIRQNATDIRSFIDDLYVWEDEMNNKPNNKKPTKPSNPKQNKENFPIRGQALSDEEEDIPVQPESNTNENSEAVARNPNLKKEHATTSDYYNEWNKVDWDREADKVETEKPKKVEKKPSQQPANPMQRTSGAEKNTKIVIKGGRSSYNEVESLKEKGNLYFKSGELDKAIAHYSEAIEKGVVRQVNDELMVTLYSNRAMTYLKLREYLKTEEDCNCALKLNEKHVKSLMRRGQARKRLEKHKAALKDFEKAVEVEPENKEILDEIRLGKKKLETIKEEQKKKMVLPMSVTSKPKTTIKVEDYDPEKVVEPKEDHKTEKSDNNKSKETSESENVTKKQEVTVTSHGGQVNGEVTSEFLGLKDVEGKLVKHDEDIAETAEESAKQKVHFRLDLNVQEAEKKGGLEPVALSKQPKKSALKRKNQSISEEEKPKKKDARLTDEKIEKAVSQGKEMWHKKIIGEYEKTSGSSTDTKGRQEASRVPDIANSNEFLTSWKHIKDSEEACEKFLQGQAKPERFGEIFAAGVDFDLYMEIIRFGLKVAGRNNELPVRILQGLGNVKRFEINVKLMVGNEKKVVKEIIEKVKGERQSQEVLEELTKKYKV